MMIFIKKEKKKRERGAAALSYQIGKIIFTVKEVPWHFLVMNSLTDKYIIFIPTLLLYDPLTYLAIKLIFSQI